ncbi:MAG: MBL fold metallo-hydrolase [Defluviitaleaceae bacterium]|nr:MBL fold metallo-hydrolase [Defluviitaleaceae bacterium]MCL2240071.1 MBL fold metallo-hydrolase [Defluviitaleaceae bacterium]MCL2240286.1 MBL fold metallo-hydrolase [Defluviitaleaceae bacterium]
MSYYKVKALHEGIYSICEPDRVFCYLLVGEKEAILYDAAFGFGPLRACVAEITSLPVTVVLGHGHYDHACGAVQFGGALIHPADEVLCRKHTSRTGRRRALENNAQRVPPTLDHESFIHLGSGDLGPLEVGRVFDLGGMEVEAVALEGHTAGSVGLLVRQRRVLLVSDALGPHQWLYLQDSLPMADYIAMLERVQSLPFDTFYTGHSNIPRPKTEIDRYKAVAQNATPEKATPYSYLPELGGMLYEEGDIGIIFNPDKI